MPCLELGKEVDRLGSKVPESVKDVDMSYGVKSRANVLPANDDGDVPLKFRITKCLEQYRKDVIDGRALLVAKEP